MDDLNWMNDSIYMIICLSTGSNLVDKINGARHSTAAGKFLPDGVDWFYSSPA